MKINNFANSLELYRSDNLANLLVVFEQKSAMDFSLGLFTRIARMETCCFASFSQINLSAASAYYQDTMAQSARVRFQQVGSTWRRVPMIKQSLSGMR